MERARIGGLIAATLLFGLCAPTRAQNTIEVPIVSLYASDGAGMGQNYPFIWEQPIDPAPYGRHLHAMQPGSYAEYIVTTTTPGMYTVSLFMRQPSDDNLVFALESRPFPDSLYNTRYATVDTKNYGRIADYIDSGPLATEANVPLTIPLVAGDNILRLFNTTGRHMPATSYPPDLSDPNNRPSGPPWSDLWVGRITLNRTGDLPALGTITGTITGNQPAGIPVRNALVTANPPGQSPVELSWFWKNGWYTYTRPDGTYTLRAPLGQQEVKAGRPSSYQVQGATATVTVAATPVTANITLPSIFFRNASNEWTAYVQAEYFEQRNGPIALIAGDGPPENGYKMGWFDPGDAVGMLIDVPEAGNYEVTSAYTNGGGEGTYRVYTDLGPSTTDTQPPGGWTTLLRKTYANPIFLAQGTQMLFQTNISGNSDADGIHLRRLNTPITVGLVQGKVTNSYGGAPVANANVVIGGITVRTDAEGNYRAYLPPGSNAITVNHQDMDAAVSGSVDITTGGTAERNFSIGIRPVVALTTANGYAWKYIANTGGTADYSAVGASETGFANINVPSDVSILNGTHDMYVWYRLHFTLPAGFLATIPNRMLRLRIPGIDDTDQTWLNGTLIGQTGAAPNPPLPVQDPAWRNPGDPNIPFIVYPGLDIAYNNERLYYFPASLLQPGDNVLAIKVFQLNGGGGITTAPVLEIAPATGGVSGKVLVGGTGQAGIRVAAMNAAALTSDWAMTTADGSFTLDNVAPGFTVIGAAKPGIKAVSVTTPVAANATVTNLTLNTTVEPDGVAPLYDDFVATAPTDATWWTKLWDAVGLINHDPLSFPKVYEPGYPASALPIEPGVDTPIPGSISIESGTGERTGILSKDRFSKYASVNAGRLISAIPVETATGGQPNVIFRLIGDPAADDPLLANNNNFVELDLEGYLSWMTDLGFAEQRVRYRLWAAPGGEISTGAVPGEYLSMTDLSREKPLDLIIVRLGSYYDFYLNNTFLHGQNLPNAAADNHKLFPYSFSTAAFHTWDWVKAGPKAYSIAVKGDLTGNGTIDTADVAKALRLWSGLDTATAADIQNGDVVAGSGITLLDAIGIARTANGL